MTQVNEVGVSGEGYYNGNSDSLLGGKGPNPQHQQNNYPIGNPTYEYFQKEEKLHGFLSQQFPTIANPAPLGMYYDAFSAYV